MSVYYQDEQVTLHLGDALETLRALPDESVDCIVTSPPYYGLRDYGVAGQYGLEASPAAYVETMRAVFSEAKRALAKDGTCWINLGDSYVSPGGQTDTTAAARLTGHPSVRLNGRPPRATAEIAPKNLLGMPWRIAFALQDDGWILRNEIIWHKPNAMPESVTDRLSNRHEHLFLFSRSPRYWFDLDAIREAPTAAAAGKSWAERRSAGAPKRHGLAGAAAAKDGDFAPGAAGRNPGDVWNRRPETDYRIDRDHDATNRAGRNPGDLWSITTKPYPDAHFAVMPIDLPIRCIKAGCKPGGTVLDPFSGSGTTGEAARNLDRKYIGIDLNPAYHDLAIKRFAQGVLTFEQGDAA